MTSTETCMDLAAQSTMPFGIACVAILVLAFMVVWLLLDRYNLREALDQHIDANKALLKEFRRIDKVHNG